MMISSSGTRIIPERRFAIFDSIDSKYIPSTLDAWGHKVD